MVFRQRIHCQGVPLNFEQVDVFRPIKTKNHIYIYVYITQTGFRVVHVFNKLKRYRLKEHEVQWIPKKKEKKEKKGKNSNVVPSKEQRRTAAWNSADKEDYETQHNKQRIHNRSSRASLTQIHRKECDLKACTVHRGQVL